MSSRQKLLCQWQTRLAESEFALAHGSPQLRWLRHIYVRMYRFLIARYGTPGEHVGEDPQPAAGQPRMPFVDNTARRNKGRSPRSSANIRGTLEHVHQANAGRVVPGPLQEGLTDEDWVTVAAASSRLSPRRCREILDENAIESRTVRQGGDRLVMVPSGDARQARGLIEHHISQLRFRRGHRARLLYRAANVANGLLAGMIGGIMFAMLLAGGLVVLALLDVGPARLLILCGAAAGAVAGAAAAWRLPVEGD